MSEENEVGTLIRSEFEGWKKVFDRDSKITHFRRGVLYTLTDLAHNSNNPKLAEEIEDYTAQLSAESVEG